MNPQHSICFLCSHITIQNREVQSTWTDKGVPNYWYMLVSVSEKEMIREKACKGAQDYGWPSMEEYPGVGRSTS